MSEVANNTTRPTRLLLHACCGPCLLEPLDALTAEADSVTIVFANSNIYPREEYERRRDTLFAHALDRRIEVVALDYDPLAWSEAVAPLADRRTERCQACYRVRLGQAAAYAASNGFDAIATTLTVSPYQDPQAIREEGERAAEGAGVAYLHRDFRDHYAEATRRSRELGMYRQNYCGCSYSAVEARNKRDARKAARRSARRATCEDTEP